MARMRAPQRRRQILEVAADLFAARGYKGTTTSDLAAAAGVAEPILYRHFSNKLDLFVTLVDEVGTEVVHAWEEALESVDEPGERLRTLLASNPATHARGRGVYRVIFQAMNEPPEEREIVASLRRHLRRLHAFLNREIAALQTAGVVRDDESANALAWLLMSVAVGFGMVAPLSPVGHTSTSGKERMQRLLEELLSP